MAGALKRTAIEADAAAVEDTPADPLQYLRVTIANDDDDVSMTIYELDARGWVYRQVQMRSEGNKFAPEDVLMCRPVNLPAMRGHPCTEAMTSEDFELLWSELASERPFMARLPDARMAWEGTLDDGHGRLRVRWQPFAEPALGWTEIPGFLELFVHGDVRDARRACAQLFLDRPIAWRALAGNTLANPRCLPTAA